MASRSIGFLSSLCLCASVVSPAYSADPKAKLTYDQHVLPILTTHCVGCHKGESAKGGLDLSTFAKIKEGGAGGEVIKPGDPDGSRLWQLTAHKAQPFMPPKKDMLPQ